MSGGIERQILRYLADLATDPTPVLDVSAAGKPGDVRPVPQPFFGGDEPVKGWGTSLSRERVLHARDQLQPNERLLRLGYGWVGGKTVVDDRDRRVLLPVVSVAVTLDEAKRGRPPVEALRAVGDITVSHLVTDPAARDRIMEGVVFPGDAGLEQWLRGAAEAMGFELEGVVEPPWLEDVRSSPDLVAAPLSALYLARDVADLGRGPTLDRWASRLREASDSAFARVYGLASATETAPPPPAAGATPVVPARVEHATIDPADLPVTLDPGQLAAVRAAHDHDVSVISGPPGTGKSHTVAAVALDAIARGESVLVATRSHHAASVLIEYLADAGGVAPVVFGDNQSRRDLAAELLDRTEEATLSLAGAEARLADADRAWELRLAQITEALENEAILSGRSAVQRTLEETSARADLSVLSDLFETHESPDSGFVRRWWVNRKIARELGDADRVSTRRRITAERMRWDGGLRLGPLFTEYTAVDRERRRGIASAIAGRFSGLDPAEQVAIRRLSSALRGGRVRRRQLLATLDIGAVFRASPLWVGTIADIEDILPSTPGLFDLVIIDEASQVDQTLAPPALLRAKRVVAVGDAKQLSHVSFIADQAIDVGLDEHGLEAADCAPLLDVRRFSLLDVAASTGVTSALSTHYRCAPHLIDFSASRFYDDRLRTATHHPSRDRLDCIDIVRVDGTRTTKGNHDEARRVVELVKGVIDDGFVGSIGVVTPLRVQADLLEACILDELASDEIKRHQIAVGTVHAFQGAERDHMFISLAVDDDSPEGSIRFVEDPNLFNVMITRARHAITLVTSLSEPKRGLVSAYLRHADDPSEPPSQRDSRGPWTRRVGDYLADQGLTVRFGYPVGHEVVDLVVGDGDDAVALECEVHPDGPEAHIRRRALLVSMGWRIADAFESRWGDDLAEFAIRFGNGDLLAED